MKYTLVKFLKYVIGSSLVDNTFRTEIRKTKIYLLKNKGMNDSLETEKFWQFT